MILGQKNTIPEKFPGDLGSFWEDLGLVCGWILDGSGVHPGWAGVDPGWIGVGSGWI